MRIGKFLIADVFKLDFLQNEVTAISCDTLTDAGIEIKANTKEVRGGQGNNLIATLHSSRDITVTATEATFDFGVLATSLGSPIVVGAGVGYTPRQSYTAKTSETKTQIALKKTPLDANKFVIYGADGIALVKTTDYTLTGGTVEFVGSKVKDGDVVTVDAYKYSTNAKSERISIGANTYAKGGKLVLTTLEIDSATENPVSTIQFVFPNCIPLGDVKFDTKSERDAVPTNLQFNVLKGLTDEVGYVLREPIEG